MPPLGQYKSYHLAQSNKISLQNNRQLIYISQHDHDDYERKLLAKYFKSPI